MGRERGGVALEKQPFGFRAFRFFVFCEVKFVLSFAVFVLSWFAVCCVVLCCSGVCVVLSAIALSCVDLSSLVLCFVVLQYHSEVSLYQSEEESRLNKTLHSSTESTISIQLLFTCTLPAAGLSCWNHVFV